MWRFTPIVEIYWAVLGPCWGRLGGFLGRPGAVLEASWAVFGASWAVLGRREPEQKGANANIFHNPMGNHICLNLRALQDVLLEASLAVLEASRGPRPYWVVLGILGHCWDVLVPT